MTQLIFLLVLICVMIGLRVLAGNLDRDRIREYIGGGKVLNIVWNPLGPGWWGSSERIYDVKYQTRHGKVCEATCKTRMGGGVYWTGHEPPSGVVESEQNASGETITCLKCGTTIPAGNKYCHKCGWSYMAGQHELS